MIFRACLWVLGFKLGLIAAALVYGRAAGIFVW